MSEQRELYQRQKIVFGDIPLLKDGETNNVCLWVCDHDRPNAWVDFNELSHTGFAHILKERVCLVPAYYFWQKPFPPNESR